VDWYLRLPEVRDPDPDLIMIRPALLEDATYGAEAGALRVLALGDSFTEGHPVGDANSYPAVLERILGQGGRIVKVANLGIGDSGPDQHLRLLKLHGIPRFRPDVVLWALYANDLDDNIRLPVYDIEDGALVPLDATQHWLYRRQKIYDAIPLPNRWKRNSRILWTAMKSWEAVHRSVKERSPQRRAWAGRKLVLALREAEQLATRHGFRLLIVLITPQSMFMERADPAGAKKALLSREYERLRRLVDEAGLSYLEPMWRPPPPQPPETLEAPEFGVFADASRDDAHLGGRHLNEAGYRLLAQRIADALSSED
jgi:lysophospholipase L1-like esterase